MVECVDLEFNGQALGRNGLMQVIALRIGVVGDEIIISPITSKKKTGRCYIAFPKNDVVKIVNALLQL